MTRKLVYVRRNLGPPELPPEPEVVPEVPSERATVQEAVLPPLVPPSTPTPTPTPAPPAPATKVAKTPRGAKAKGSEPAAPSVAVADTTPGRSLSSPPSVEARDEHPAPVLPVAVAEDVPEVSGDRKP